MTDNPHPTKKSRFFSQLKWFPRSSSKANGRPKTPPPPPSQTAVSVSSQVRPPSHLSFSNTRNGFIQQLGHQTNLTQSTYLAAPNPLQQSLVSPRTETAAAFRNLSVEDHRSGGRDQVRAETIAIATTQTTLAGAPETNYQVPSTQTPDASRYGTNQILQSITVPSQPTRSQYTLWPHQASTQTAKLNHTHVQNQQPLPTPSYASSVIQPQLKQTVKSVVPKIAPQLVVDGSKLNPPSSQPTHPFSIRNEQTKFITPPENFETNSASTTLNPLKRKRPTALSLPPAHIYTRTNNPTFNIFHSILLYPELCYHLALHLPLSDLISLYAISRDYHTILSTRFTTLIISLANHLCPTAVTVFPFRCYAHLCVVDPAPRIPHPDPELAARGIIRKVPGFKWLKMLLHREKIVHEIMALAAQRGVPFPRRCKLVLLKVWFIMDIPDNARRVGYIHNERLFNELDLYFGMCVIVRLDMLFNDPVGSEKRDGARRMILAQRSLTPLMLVLKGEIWKTKIEVMREWVRWKYELNENEREMVGDQGVFGVPANDCGKLKLQFWGGAGYQAMKTRMAQSGEEVLWLLRPDQLIVREALKRGLRFKGHILKCLLYGFVDPRSLEDVNWAGEEESRSTVRREWRLEGHGEYDFDDLSGGGRCVDVEDGGDRVLDLGRREKGSRRCKKEEVGEQEKKWRRGRKSSRRSVMFGGSRRLRMLGLQMMI